MWQTSGLPVGTSGLPVAASGLPVETFGLTALPVVMSVGDVGADVVPSLNNSFLARPKSPI